MNELRRYKYAEHLMYSYTQNLVRLELAQTELDFLQSQNDVQAQNYSEKFFTVGHTRDPVSEFHQRIERQEQKIKTLKRRIAPVKELLNILDSPYALDGNFYAQLKDILVFLYFGKNLPAIVCMKLKISKPTLYRRKKELVKLMLTVI